MSRVLIPGIVVVLGSTAVAFGQTVVPIGDEFQVNTYTTDRQVQPSVSVGPVGGFVVVWISDGSDGTDTGFSIQGQRFSSDGSALGAEFQINS